jgi:pimeloyl-ACP methyl ester carboxylesterase
MRTKLLLAGALASLALLAGCGGPAPIKLAGEVQHPVTSDGWKLTVEHFPPAAGTPKRPRPVLICHGILANRSYFKIDENNSVVAQLNRAGYDVWLMDLRGRADAGSPGYLFGEHRYTYSVDDYILRDMDTALGYVTSRTGSKDVIWMGHSLGGIIAYARLGTVGEPRIAQLVTLGSPSLQAPASRTLLWGIQHEEALGLLPALPVASLGSATSSLGVDVAPSEIYELFSNPENFRNGEMAKLVHYTGTDGSGPELAQMSEATKRGGLASLDGKVSYSAGLGNVQVPALVVAARRDQLADPSTVRRVYERLGSRDKELLILGRANGFSQDYGHTDLIVGEGAMREVVPRIVTWLNGRNEPLP